MAEWFRHATWWQVLAISLALNCATIGTSAALWYWRVHRRESEGLVRTVSSRDVALATSTTVINSASLLPAWWFWRNGTFDLVAPTFPRILVEVVYLVAGFETIMYAVHRLIHVGAIYRWSHSTHHTNNSEMSSMSLFVMHPAEPAGFALTMLALLVLWPLSVVGIACFFIINLGFGTVAHLPVDGSMKLRWWDRHLGGAVLHQGHHRNEGTNFGFFTQFWDWALRTRA